MNSTCTIEYCCFFSVRSRNPFENHSGEYGEKQIFLKPVSDWKQPELIKTDTELLESSVDVVVVLKRNGLFFVQLCTLVLLHLSALQRSEQLSLSIWSILRFKFLAFLLYIVYIT